jgi:hypothetical protein
VTHRAASSQGQAAGEEATVGGGCSVLCRMMSVSAGDRIGGALFVSPRVRGT